MKFLHFFSNMATAILVGVGVTALALVGRAALRTIQRTSGTSLSSSKYIKGGFDAQMNLREGIYNIIQAQQILSIDKLDKNELKKKHRQIMLLNHPDRGGSPYLASKINEAKDLLDKSV
jgi:DnaJ family protein C protein 19